VSGHHEHQRPERPWRNGAPLEPLPEPNELVFPWRAGEVVLGPTPRPDARLTPPPERQASPEAAS
jgi:hypothetical protein